MKRYIRSVIVPINDESEDSRCDLAKNPNTSPRDLAKLAETRNRNVRKVLAQNPNLPMEARIKLIEYRDLASFDALDYGEFSPEFLDEFAHRPENEVFLQAIAKHKNTSPETLAWLADTTDNYYTLAVVADNKNTSPETLTKLASRPEARVRMHVASNPNTPIDVLKQLTKDRNSIEVRRCAERTLEKLGGML